VQPRRGLTPYARAGNVPVIALSLLIIGYFWFVNRARL